LLKNCSWENLKRKVESQGSPSLCTIVGKFSRMIRNGETTPPVKSQTRGWERVLWWTPMMDTVASLLSPRSIEVDHDGRKKAKIKRAKGGDEGVYKESLDSMMEVRKDIAMQRRDLNKSISSSNRKSETVKT
jgi:hypothetical protein